jgi:excisionase family DNA binding protein
VTSPDDRPLPPGLVLLGLADLESLSDTPTVERTEPDASAIMSVDTAARYLGISRSHAYDLIRAGTIPHLKLGRRIIVPRRELDAMITRGVAKQP